MHKNNKECSIVCGVSIFKGVWVYGVDLKGLRASSGEHIQVNIWNIAGCAEIHFSIPQTHKHSRSRAKHTSVAILKKSIATIYQL